MYKNYLNRHRSKLLLNLVKCGSGDENQRKIKDNNKDKALQASHVSIDADVKESPSVLVQCDNVLPETVSKIIISADMQHSEVDYDAPETENLNAPNDLSNLPAPQASNVTIDSDVSECPSVLVQCGNVLPETVSKIIISADMQHSEVDYHAPETENLNAPNDLSNLPAPQASNVTIDSDVSECPSVLVQCGYELPETVSKIIISADMQHSEVDRHAPETENLCAYNDLSNLPGSETDPFHDSDFENDGDPCYVPESSTSHYSDSDPETDLRIINRVQDTVVEIVETKEDKIVTRKRKRQPETWKRNKNRKLRLEGKEHVSQSGNKVRAKDVKLVPCKCHYNCNDKFSIQDRQEILRDYLSLADERARWAFISNNVRKQLPKRRYQSKNTEANKEVTIKRKCTLVYSLTFKREAHQVCKKFFLGTLDISGKKVQTALLKKKESGVTEEDKRGKNPAPNKISEDSKDTVRCHILSIPVVDSHYCRSTTKRKYLPPGLTENRLYQDYVKYCKEHEVNPVSAYYYKHIFTSEFNYGFHRPKKDQCDYCAQFKNKTPDEKQHEQTKYDLHMIRKTEAREHKKIDKARAKDDPSFRAYTMDLEKILLTPQLEVGQLYYKRKFKTYNFTIYDLGQGTAINYMWHETNGTKGASEVASCIWSLLAELPPEVTEVTFYSDTASGQNRNSIISAMFIRAVATFKNLQLINQKFMESGHSEMECDSVHSAIETRGRKINIFVPDGWYTVARTAKITQPPYVVKEMDFTQFLNFKAYSQKLITNKKKGETSTMNWLQVKWMQYRQQEPFYINYKTRLSNAFFERLCIRLRSTRNDDIMCSELSKLYQSSLGIDEKKLKDLRDLCQKGTIPTIYHSFYLNLHSSVHSSDGNDSDDN